MSSLYNLEPNPTAKVILKTTAGDILLELFANQTPLTSRNFLQLCLDGYYDNTIFHRLVPDFIVQGGDPTGTGSGGQSSYDGGAPFADEFHSRLRFNRRGLLGMANSGSKDDNGSQFFLTLGKAEELNGRNTMFGRIEGNTIYNLVRIGEGELVEGEDSDRPMYPTKIVETDILVNPFEDMIKRTQVAHASKPLVSEAKKKPKKKAAKQMLSFGGDEDAGSDDDFVKVPKYNTKLVQAAPEKAKHVEQASSLPKPLKRPPQQKDESGGAGPRRTTLETKRDTSVQEMPPRSREISSSSSSPEPEADDQTTRLAKTNAQIADLKQSLKREVVAPAKDNAKRQKTDLDSMMPMGAKRGVKRLKPGSKEEQNQLSAFAAFQSQLGGAIPKVATNGTEKSPAPHRRNGEVQADDQKSSEIVGEEELCDLHFVPNCQSCKRWEEAEEQGDDDDLTAEGLMGHTLTFAKDRLGKSLEWKRQNEKELVVIDPREKEREILKSKKRAKA
ncbi:MAG: hypothetical protein Q9159_006658 [Coniocarpon cinnabarinum]